MPLQRMIESGKGAMLKKGKNLKYVYVDHGKQEKMDNFFFSCTDMINKPFGTAFKVLDKKKLEIINPIQVEEHRNEYEKLQAEKALEEETRDNRDIVDSTETQKLDKATIMGFREEGMAGEKIVEKLIENSATFKDRTEFSQAKYLKKKEKKYLQHFVALRPSARLLCQMYFNKAPDKILDMRSDSLAQLLTWSNVHSGCNVLLMETCKGLVTGAVMERLGNEGSVLQIHQGNNPQRTITEQFNFSVEDLERLACSFPMEKLDLLKELQNSGASRDVLLEHILGRNFVNTVGENGSTETKETTSEKVNIPEEKNTAEDVSTAKNNISVDDIKTEDKKPDGQNDSVMDIPMENSDEKQKDDNLVTENDEKTPKHDNRKRKHVDGRKENAMKTPRVCYLPRDKKIAECERAMGLLSEKNFDCLIIASKYHPKKLLLALLEYLPIGRPFVVYCQHQEPLMECSVTLREMKCAAHIEVTENWFRNLQVLSNRTHPEIVMSATGGYILRGIKVTP